MTLELVFKDFLIFLLLSCMYLYLNILFYMFFHAYLVCYNESKVIVFVFSYIYIYIYIMLMHFKILVIFAFTLHI